jgi:F-type H+-transporting ATPase subunit delta
MRETQVASRYALALFKITQKSGTTEMVATDLNQLKSYAAGHKGFLGFLLAPAVSDEDKVAFLRNLFTTRVAPQLLGFFELLLHKHRVNLLPDIANEFEELLEEHQGVIKTRVITAVYVSDEVKTRLKDKLEKLTGKKIEIIHKIDRSIIGGIIVYLHNRVIDKSVRHELKLLRHDLLQVKVH